MPASVSPKVQLILGVRFRVNQWFGTDMEGSRAVSVGNPPEGLRRKVLSADRDPDNGYLAGVRRHLFQSAVTDHETLSLLLSCHGGEGLVC